MQTTAPIGLVPKAIKLRRTGIVDQRPLNRAAVGAPAGRVSERRKKAGSSPHQETAARPSPSRKRWKLRRG
jgi:hypothetical protein